MNLLDRAIVNVCRNSWRAYNLINATVSTGGLRVPLVGGIGLGNINFIEQQFQVVLKTACAMRPNGLIVDVGANIGKFLLNLIAIDRNVPYIGFEPLLGGAAYIRRLMIDNQLSDHSVVPVALGERCGSATIRFGHESDESATLTNKTRPPSMYSLQQLVATSTADIQLADIPALSLIKIDVEGTEVSVLRGMTASLELHRPPIFMEVMPYAHLLDGTYNRKYFGELSPDEAKRVAAARRDHSMALERFLEDRDYAFYSCSREGRVATAKTLDRGKSKDSETDFLALPVEVAQTFVDHAARCFG